jgi:NTP pyrophosphatase (non-canonical NTP hydrolase)
MENKEKLIELFNEFQRLTYATARFHGFQEYEGNELFVPTKLALISSEVSEALEAHREKNDDHIGEELADVVIRTMDLAEALGINLIKKMLDKQAKNEARAFKHGNKRY